MCKKYIIFTIIILFLELPNVFAQHVKYHRVRATLTHEQLHELFDLGLDVDHFHFKENTLVAELSDHDIHILKSKKVTFKYLIKDLEKNYAKINAKADKAHKHASKTRTATVPTPANFALGTYNGYFTLQEMENHLDLMRTLYPNLITVKTSIGSSIENRPLWMVKISDNADTDETEPELFMNAVHHAREPISMSQLIFFMWHILENYQNDKEIRALVNSTELFIVPCVNPDGYYYNQTNNPNGGGMWRKNRRLNSDGTYGVDPNRNYSIGWGGSGSSGTPSSDTYRGTAAFSEPETQAIRDFSLTRNFITSFDFHAYGNYLIYPYGNVVTNNNPEIPLYNSISQFLTSHNNFVYGNAYSTVGYVASGCGDDWRYGEQTLKNKTYSFTPEVGSSSVGFYPPSSSIISLCNSTVFMNKGLMKLSTNYAEVTTSMPASISSTNTQVPFTIKNYSLTPSTYTVSINSLSPYVTSVGSALTYNTMTTLQSLTGQIPVTLDSLIPIGTIVNLEVVTSSPYHTRIDTISFAYNCAAPGGLLTSNITTNGATSSWNAVAGASGYYISLKPQSSSTWNPEVFVSGTSYTHTGLSPNTAYQWRVRADNCNQYSTVQNFTTLNTISYCTSKGNSTYYSWIDYFKLNNLARTSGSDGGYYDGSSLLANVTRGSSYTLTFSAGYLSTRYRVYWRIWIDYNNNGVFTDAGEQIYSINSTSNGNINYTLTIPSTVSVGTKRIRIAMKQGSSYAGPCETFTYGETEDYTINVQAPSQLQKIEDDPQHDITKELSEISASPNPFFDYIHVQLQPTEENLACSHDLVLMDMKGAVLAKSHLPQGVLSEAIPTADFPKGMYVLIATSSNRELKVFKMMK